MSLAPEASHGRSTGFLTSVAWSGVANIADRAFTFLTMLVLVRFLDKQAFGTATAAVTFIIFVIPITRLGVFEVVLQRRRVSDTFKTAALAVAVMSGFVGTLCLTLLAPLLSRVFNDPATGEAIIYLSPIFVLRSLSSVSEAMLTRQYGFKALALRKLSTTAIASLVAIALAMNNFGYMSIVVQQLMNATISTAILCLSYRWSLELRKGSKLIVLVIRRGTGFTGAQLISSINVSGYAVAVSALIGTAAAGVYRLAFSAVDLVLQVLVLPISQVAIAKFSEAQTKRVDPGSAYLTYIRWCLTFAMCPTIILLVAGPDFTRVLYGREYSGAGAALSILSLAVPASAIISLGTSAITVTRGATWLTSLSVAQAVVSVPLAIVGSRFGVQGICVAYVLRACLAAPLIHFAVPGVAFGKPGASAKGFLPLSVASVLAFMVGVMLEASIKDLQSSVIHLAVIATIVGAVYSSIIIASDLQARRALFGLLPSYAINPKRKHDSRG